MDFDSFVKLIERLGLPSALIVWLLFREWAWFRLLTLHSHREEAALQEIILRLPRSTNITTNAPNTAK